MITTNRRKIQFSYGEGVHGKSEIQGHWQEQGRHERKNGLVFGIGGVFSFGSFSLDKQRK